MCAVPGMRRDPPSFPRHLRRDPNRQSSDPKSEKHKDTRTRAHTHAHTSTTHARARAQAQHTRTRTRTRTHTRTRTRTRARTQTNLDRAGGESLRDKPPSSTTSFWLPSKRTTLGCHAGPSERVGAGWRLATENAGTKQRKLVAFGRRHELARSRTSFSSRDPDRSALAL